jgi:hypothetical protein
VLTRRDLGRLPQDRVLIEERTPQEIRLSWMRPENARAHSRRLKEATGEKAAVTEIQGRWQKLGVVLLWKLKRDEGYVLTRADRTAVPRNLRLLTRGFQDTVEFRFIPVEEAIQIANWERDNEGKHIVEVL